MCDYCLGTGIKIHEGTKCFCNRPKNAFFGKAKPKKKANDLLPKAHKCGPEVQEFLYANDGVEFYLCECGKMIKNAMVSA